MNRALPLALLAALLLAGACDEPPTPATGTGVRFEVNVAAREVAFGEGFALEIVRAWPRGHEPDPFSDRLLRPLVLRDEAVEQHSAGGHIVETRRYRAHAFTLTDLSIPGPVFTARPPDGGAPKEARARRIRLRVRPSIDRRAPGTPEGPGEPLAEGGRTPWVLLLLGIGLGVLVLLGVVATRRRRALAPTPPSLDPAPPREPPEHLARVLLAGVRRNRAASEEARQADAIEVAEILRDYIGQRFDVRARWQTSEEVLATLEDASAAESQAWTLLRHVFTTSDLAKFADRAPTVEARSDLLDRADAFVDATAPVGDEA